MILKLELFTISFIEQMQADATSKGGYRIQGHYKIRFKNTGK